MFVAGLGCLGVRRVAPERAPALRDAARLALAEEVAAAGAANLARVAQCGWRPATESRPRRGPRPRRTSSARVPLFAGLEPALREDVAASRNPRARGDRGVPVPGGGGG